MRRILNQGEEVKDVELVEEIKAEEMQEHQEAKSDITMTMM